MDFFCEDLVLTVIKIFSKVCYAYKSSCFLFSSNKLQIIEPFWTSRICCVPSSPFRASHLHVSCQTKLKILFFWWINLAIVFWIRRSQFWLHIKFLFIKDLHFIDEASLARTNGTYYAPTMITQFILPINMWSF